MFPSRCSGFVPVASRGFGQPSVWSGNMCRCLSADAVTSDRNTITPSTAAVSASCRAKCATLPYPHGWWAVSLKRRGGSVCRASSATFPDIVAVRQVLMDGLTAVKDLTRHTAGCWPCRTAHRLSSRAPEPSGTLYMGLGNLAPNCDARPVFGKNTCVDIQGLACITCRLHPGLYSHGLRSFPKGSAFSQGACVDRSMGDTRLVPHSIALNS